MSDRDNSCIYSLDCGLDFCMSTECVSYEERKVKVKNIDYKAEVERLENELALKNHLIADLKHDVSTMTTLSENYREKFAATKALAEKYKVCGNCYHYDIVQDFGGMCCLDPDHVPADRDGKCKDWKFNEDQDATHKQEDGQ